MPLEGFAPSTTGALLLSYKGKWTRRELNSGPQVILGSDIYVCSQYKRLATHAGYGFRDKDSDLIRPCSRYHATGYVGGWSKPAPSTTGILFLGSRNPTVQAAARSGARSTLSLALVFWSPFIRGHATNLDTQSDSFSPTSKPFRAQSHPSESNRNFLCFRQARGPPTLEWDIAGTRTPRPLSSIHLSENSSR